MTFSVLEGEPGAVQLDSGIIMFHLLRKRTRIFLQFWQIFARYTMHVREVIAGLVLTLLGGGCIIARVEGLKLGESIYFAFVTGLTIGYGDITPTTAIGRLVSILIGVIGMIFMGLVIAIATRALSDAAQSRMEQETLSPSKDPGTHALSDSP